ncbi:MAG: hydrogenase expression/formation protein HypE [Candidatus Diapherotrites archaeon]|nr:hydrogenase expression/formation protein HypE [Candidatus Diapherotrites archaeon]
MAEATKALQGRISLAHGAGGKSSAELLDLIFSKIELKNTPGGIGIDCAEDSALINLVDGSKTIAFTTDTYTVKPLFFPGADIGWLSVCGTVNDLSVMGAKPVAVSCSLVIEEGFPVQDLEKIIGSMNRASKTAGVPIVCGDTKVMEKGSIDGLIINTAGIGEVADLVRNSGAKVGDTVIVSGPVGDHGIALLSVREGLSFETLLESDAAPLNTLMQSIPLPHAAKDPTRGGLNSALNEIALKSSIPSSHALGRGIEIRIDEDKIPVRKEVKAACAMLGLDPLSVACEGRVVVCTDKPTETLEAMKSHPLGKGAQAIGRVTEKTGKSKAGVFLRTAEGGTRVLRMQDEVIPRIC